MGKHDPYLAKLSLKQEEPAFQEKINSIKKSVEHLSTDEIGKALILARDRTTQAEQERKKAHRESVAYEQLLCDSVEASGGQTLWGFSNGDSLSIELRSHPNIKDTERFCQWCRENGYGDMMTMHWNTLKTLVRERVEMALPEIPGVHSWCKKTVVFRKGRS